jgi:hypothetical protein
MKRDGISTLNILVGKSENKASFARSRRRLENIIKLEVVLSACSGSRQVEGSCEHGIELSASVNGEFL